VVTKLGEAEAVVQEEISRGLDAVIVNPVYMIGPWDWKPSSGRMLLEVGAGKGLFAPAATTSSTSATWPRASRRPDEGPHRPPLHPRRPHASHASTLGESSPAAAGRMQPLGALLCPIVRTAGLVARILAKPLRPPPNCRPQFGRRDDVDAADDFFLRPAQAETRLMLTGRLNRPWATPGTGFWTTASPVLSASGHRSSRGSVMPHILVVEDEEHLAIGIEFNLEAEGFQVTTAGDGQSVRRSSPRARPRWISWCSTSCCPA
jgi:hypothetical protein